MSKFVLSFAETENFEITNRFYDSLADAQEVMKDEYNDVVETFGEENLYEGGIYDDSAKALIDGGYDMMWLITEVV